MHISWQPETTSDNTGAGRRQTDRQTRHTVHCSYSLYHTRRHNRHNLRHFTADLHSQSLDLQTIQFRTIHELNGTQTRSKAVARIADRTASHHFWGHVTSSVTWPFDTPYVISYWWSFGTESLSPADFEILRTKCIGVTTLTFQGHVTSLVTWPFDSP